MAKTISCKDVGPDCNFTASAWVVAAGERACFGTWHRGNHAGTDGKGEGCNQGRI